MQDESDAWRRVDGAWANRGIQRRVGDEARVDGRRMGREKTATNNGIDE